MGILYVVATPIGNLEDITIRAIKTLLMVDAIACEDTRKAGFLLKTVRERYQNVILGLIENPDPRVREITDSRVGDDKQFVINPVATQRLISYYEQNELQRIPEIINALKNGLNVALISDAGTPLLSDPGFKLVREAVREGIRVESIPGPSSILAALTSSGLPTDKFLFLGYPPRKPGHRMTFFENIKKSQEFVKATCILFEAPHKLVKTLEEMQSVFGDIEIVLARELTKVHEEVRKEKISKLQEELQSKDPRGEFVILFNFS